MKIVLTKAAGAVLVPVEHRVKKVRSPLLRLRSYNAWRGMLERCRNPKHQFFKYYGGAGIVVCQEWTKYGAFLVDMGEPEKGMQIDRIDPRGNYEKSNCRWATASQNSANRRGWSKAGFKGVSVRPSGRFAAVMNGGKRTITLGTFDTAAEAARAYDAAAIERFGVFALTNESLGKFEP